MSDLQRFARMKSLLLVAAIIATAATVTLAAPVASAATSRVVGTPISFVETEPCQAAQAAMAALEASMIGLVTAVDDLEDENEWIDVQLELELEQWEIEMLETARNENMQLIGTYTANWELQVIDWQINYVFYQNNCL